MPNPTIVSAALNDKELRDSITKLVEDYKNSLDDMKTATTNAVKDIQETIKSIGSTKVDFSGTFDGLEKAKKKMTAAASGGGGGTTPKATYPDNTIGALEESIRLEKEKRREMELGTNELREQNKLIEEQKAKLKEQKESTDTQLRQAARKQLIGAFSMPARQLADAEKKLLNLEMIASSFKGTGILDTTQWNRLQNQIQATKEKIERLKSKKPMTMQDILGMDESSVEAIAKKMQALKLVTIDPQNAQQVKQLGEEYTRLGKKQNEYLGKNLLIQKSNHMLASTFGYIRNRIIYAFTLGALASFFRDLRNIRAEYEMLDRSLGILVGDFEKGTRIFNELNEMALKSPFTLIELGTAAKQLTAYNFAADEVVDTTRRIADISAALGVPIERLVYNLGQIKAQGSLTARDARDFANAGLAIVPMLADMYTKQKAFGKELTTTADVYDMMSKKMVSYGDVLKVIQQVTDEGGKFFNFQARQADTLKVQMANLSLAYNNMMNDIGASNQGLLTGSIQLFRSMFQNWREISRVVLTAVSAFGTYRTISMIVASLNSKMFVGSVLVGLRNYIRGIQSATGAMATFNAVTRANPIALLITALVTAASYFVFFNNSVKATSIEVERFGENASKQLKKVETLGKVLNGVNEKSITYKNSLSELNQILSEYGLTEIKNRNEINSKIEQTIELIKEEGKERQYANNIAKGEETYAQNTQKVKEDIKNSLSELEGWFGTTSKIRREILDNSDAITDVTSSIIEENISYVVNKSGEEAYEGLKKIREKVGAGLKSMGLSDEAANFVLNKEYINVAIKGYRLAAEEHENYNQKIKNYYDEATKATKSTMSMTEKVEANSRALRNGSVDALSLYNRIYDIVKLAQQRHTINFDLKLTADNPPKWMLDKSLPELQRLAQRFAAIAQSGGAVRGYDKEGTYQQALRYASAARQKQEEAERAARMKDNTKTKKERDAILDTIKEEISLTKKLQGEYDKLTAKGASHADAIKDVQDRYANTIKLLDIDLGKFGLPKFDTNIITGKDPNKQLKYFKNLRDILTSKGMLNLDRSKVIDAVIQELDVSAKTYNLDKITKGLNNELDRLKEEYELAVSLDADPELGSMFADWMGIDMSDLPRTAQEYAKEYTDILNKYLKDKKSDIKLPNLLDITNEDLRAFQEQADSGIISQEWVDNITKGVKASRDVFKKETSDQIKDWDKLLEKYAEYETKVNKIQNDAVKERVTFAQQFGNDEEKSLALSLQTQILAATDPQERQRLIQQLQELVKSIAGDDKAKLNIVTAIDNSQDQGIAKTNFEEFQKSPEWIIATGELSGMTNKAIKGLIASLEKYKKTAKGLDGKQIKNINNALKNLYREQRKENPFGAIANMIDKAKERMTDVLPEMASIASQIDEIEEKVKNGDATEEEIKTLDDLKERLVKLADVGKISASEWVESITSVYSAIKGAIGLFDDLAKAIGGSNASDVEKIFSVLDKAAQGAQIGSSFGGYGAAIGGVVGGLAGLISTFADKWSGNENINKSIEVSTQKIRTLEREYKRLEKAIDDAYGTDAIGAQRLMMLNKEAELAELERQLELEKSRKAKNRDQEKIDDLRDKIEELRYEVDNAAKEIILDLLDIGDAQDWANNFVKGMIDAFREGENYMKSYDDAFRDMIDNMIAKAIMGKVIGERIEQMISNIQDMANARAETDPDVVAAKKELDRVVEMREHLYNIHTDTPVPDEVFEKADRLIEESQKKYEEVYSKAATPTPEEISSIREQVASWRSDVKEEFDAYMDAFGVGFGSSDTQLSALQQGIQGITEDTAGALEAYMNGVSQQVYYQSDLLTQIRDAVVGFNLDVQVASMSQILLQLRSSYEMQTAIHSMLEGWSSPNGMSVRVEMV